VSIGAAIPAYGQIPSEDGADVGNIFPAAPRELRQNLTRAQAAIADERYSDAADELGQILGGETSDDYFLGRPGLSDAQQSLKTEALELIGSMPAKGRQIYETKFGFDAKAELDKALAEGSLVRLNEVARRFFHTKAGYEATLLVGRTLLDQGRPLAAALTLKRIADSPVAASQYDPELSVLLATCWVHARMPEKATEVLVALRGRNPQARVRLLDGDEALFSSDDQALAWLERIVGGGRTPLALAATQWIMFRGNESRNATTSGGVPLLNYRWSLPTVNEPSDELKVKSIGRSLRDSGQPNIAALQPLVVQDTVIYRAPDSSKLLGVDLKTGKRTWVFPPFEDGPLAPIARNTLPVTSRGAATVNLRDQELRQRVWEDHAFGQVSSDGRFVYVIDDLGYAAGSGTIRGPQVIVRAGGINVPNSSWSKPHNLLVALDLSREGYQVWAVGGNEPGNPALVGAFFLGPPLPLGDQLFALVEINSEIRLVCLNAATGALEWKQQLAVVEDAQQIVFDRVRRLAGASPSFADGVLICPTSAGATVAVDLATRSLRWGYQYKRWDWIRRNTGAFGGRASYAAPNPAQGNWLDSTATIADGSVILTPVESEELHCLDLLSGKARWPAQPRDDGLFVACVHRGKIIVVGKSQVRAVTLADGKPAWTEPIKLDADMPTGRGFYTDKYYFLPLTGQQLAKIDLDEGTIVSRAKTEIDLGNAVCYKDQLVTQSAQHVASFFLTEPLLEWIDETLKKDPENPKAMSLKGQVLLQEGKRSESLDLLRRAVAKNPNDLSARSLLVKVMVSLLRDDFATNFALAEELDRLVTDPVQRREILRWRAQGLIKAGKHAEALAALLALADQWDRAVNPSASADALDSAERDLAVRPDRWLQGQLASLARTGDDALRERLAGEVQKRLDKAVHADSAADLRAFVDLFGFHPLADRARLELAEKLILVEQLLEAELLAGELVASPDRATAAHATATLAAVYEKARRLDVAARYYAVLRAQYGDVVCRGGMTGAQLADKAASGAVALAGPARAWPKGRIDVTAADSGEATRSNLVYAQSRYSLSLSQHIGATLSGLRIGFDPSKYEFLIRDDAGKQLSVASLRGPDNSFRRLVNLSYTTHTGKANGHLVVINMGDQVLAIDALRGERGGSDGQLWKLDAVEIDPTTIRSTYAQPRMSANPLAGNRMQQLYDPSGRINFYTGPVQSLGVCFQKGRQLLCVDPLTGTPLWERGQIPAAADIFGDRELIFVADPTSDEALVLSAIDGSLIGRRKVERAERRWATHGRRVLAWEQTGMSITVKLYDAWQQGPPLWSKQVSVGSRGTLVESDELAILEPGGTLTVLSLADGKLRFAAPLDSERSLGNIHVLRSREQYVLIVNQDAANNESPPGYMISPIGTSAAAQQGRVHGRVYAFDRRTGKSQWQMPAFVAFHGLLVDQPSESPLLFFVRNKNRVSSPSSRTQQAGSVLCLDRRDGRIVWDSENETDSFRQIAGAIGACDPVVDLAKKTVTLSVVMSQNVRNFTFQLTDLPRAPEPPAQTGNLSSLTVGDVAGALDRSIEGAFDLLNQGLAPARGLLPGVRRMRPAIPAQPPQPGLLPPGNVPPGNVPPGIAPAVPPRPPAP
jgi:outer membrane protein assembly factor BamB/tetratricopeptide (TPR) repeat protein